MNAMLQQLPITLLVLFHGGPAWPQLKPNSTHQFSTKQYRIEMRVSFPAIYEGRRLAVYRSAEPDKQVCLSLGANVSPCTENFVGALAVVTFIVKHTADTKSAAESIRERVTLVNQSPGMPDRPPFTMSVRLVNGIGADVQVFGYDESALPKERRRAERDAATVAWRRFRQELYMDEDEDSFAVIEWLHTIRGISILRVEGRHGE